jgi:hypothetical protein
MDSFVLSDSDLSSDTDEEIIEMNVVDFGSVVNKKPKQFLFNKVEFNNYKMNKDLKIDIKETENDSTPTGVDTLKLSQGVKKDSTICNIK